MPGPVTRRDLFRTAAFAGGSLAVSALPNTAEAGILKHPGWVFGRLTGAQAIVETLKQQGTNCVFGIPGAQENELWDEFKARGLPYLLCTHEYSAATMADGAARATGKPGVLCIVPGPGITNALTGLGEAKLDSIPLVAIVGDISNGPKAKPFQVHSLHSVNLLQPVCKSVIPVCDVRQIPEAIQKAFACANSGEPGPVAVVVPLNLLIDVADFRFPPSAIPAVPFDSTAFDKALNLLADPHHRVGIYAGQGCQDFSGSLVSVAEFLQAPVATSVSGKGAMPEDHPLAVGWGFGPHANPVAEKAFQHVSTLLAIGVKFSEVSTGYYGNPKIARVIHVDANCENFNRIVPADVAVHADAGLFLSKLIENSNSLRRVADVKFTKQIEKWKCDAEKNAAAIPKTTCGIDPVHLIRTLRCHLPDDGLLYTDVSASEHLAAEHFVTKKPRTYFNPVDNQSMGWSLPAALGAQRVCLGRTVATLTGDGCFLMSAMELSTAAREGLPVKFFILDDRAYHYMQMLQKPAYRRTTATHLAKLDYKCFAQALGLGYIEANKPQDLNGAVKAAFAHAGPVLVRIATDYGDRKIRWIEAVRDRFVKELTPDQKARFLTRVGVREVGMQKRGDD